MSSTLRQKRYKRYLFSEEELRTQASLLREQISPLEEIWISGLEHPAEIVATYIYRFLKIFRPKDFLGGPHSQPLALGELKRLPPHVALFAERSFRSTPLAVNRSLVAWAEGRIQLELLDTIPSAEEILRVQSCFARVVTCYFKPEKLLTWVEGVRDPLGFVLHDLIHADHFFHDLDLARAQQQFYLEVLRRYEAGEFAKLLVDDPQFEEEFQYVIGDMNSHPAHLQQTLAKIQTLALERRESNQRYFLSLF